MKNSYSITLKEDAKPFQATFSKKVPLPLYQKAVGYNARYGVISRVDQFTDWSALMVVTTKSNGKVRVYVDLGRVNE